MKQPLKFSFLGSLLFLGALGVAIYFVPDVRPNSMESSDVASVPKLSYWETKLTPRLREWIATEPGDRRVDVLIGFSELPATGNDPGRSIEERLDERGRRYRAFQAPAIERLRPYGLVVKEQSDFINVLLGSVPLRSMSVIASQPEVQYVEERLGYPPPAAPLLQNRDSNNDVADARGQIRSDSYRDDASVKKSVIADLDTGVRSSHRLIQDSGRLLPARDCVNGGNLCEDDGGPYDPGDCSSFAGGHGTRTIAVLTGDSIIFGDDFRGVTSDLVYSLKVYRRFLPPEVRLRDSCLCCSDSVAVVRAFRAATLLKSNVIVAEVQDPEQNSHAIEQAADKAFDDAIVVAANGNNPPYPTVTSPARARRVLAAGAFDIHPPGETSPTQSLGPAPDGRIKPDVQVPTNSETASATSDYALEVFSGTSGATPYLGGAAALVRDWLFNPRSGYRGFL